MAAFALLPAADAGSPIIEHVMSPTAFRFARPAAAVVVSAAIGAGALLLAACQQTASAHLRLQSAPSRLVAFHHVSRPPDRAPDDGPRDATVRHPLHLVAFPLDTLIPLHLTTFDGSGQVVHPDVVILPASWQGGGAELAMAITPYPYGDPDDENPSVFTSTGGVAWAPPAGARNPVERPHGDAYLSDPALVFDAQANHLRMYYREVVDSENVIRFVTTGDGVRWTKPRETIRVPAHELLSPSVVRRSDSTWMMWSVNGGPDGCANETAFVELRRSADGVHWDEPARVALHQPGGYPWHIDVKWIASLHEYWALYNLKKPGTCLTQALYLATSPDGVHWTTYRHPVLRRGAIPAFADVVYRSSFVYTPDDDMVTFYFSGARQDGNHYVWSGAEERRPRAELFAQLERRRAVTVAANRRANDAPLESPSPSNQRTSPVESAGTPG